MGGDMLSGHGPTRLQSQPANGDDPIREAKTERPGGSGSTEEDGGTALRSEDPGERRKLHSEHQILRVLWANQSEHLVRSEVHKRLNPGRPGLGRVGQILVELQAAGLLDRRMRRAQGSKRAAAYALSPKGIDLCRRLGLDKDERDLFSITDETINEILTADCLSQTSETPGRIVAFHAQRGGVGRSTMVAHTARLLAERHGGSGWQLLVLDLDLDAPGLDDYLAPQGLRDCRGLRGLVVDFYHLRPQKRSQWLLDVLLQPGPYVLPFPGVPGLFYLPSGFAGLPTDREVPFYQERAEALARLWEEVSLESDWRKASADSQRSAAGSFLTELRQALRETYDKTLLDCQTGTSLGAWAAIQMLSDEIVLCPRLTETATEESRAILASFIKKKRKTGQVDGGVAFVFAPSRLRTKRADLNNWIEKHLLKSEKQDVPRVTYRAVALQHNRRLETKPTTWRGSDCYDPVTIVLERPGEIEKLFKDSSDESIPLSVRLLVGEVGATLDKENKDKASILGGSLASSLGQKKVASKIRASPLGRQLDNETLELADRIEEITKRPDVRILD